MATEGGKKTKKAPAKKPAKKRPAKKRAASGSVAKKPAKKKPAAKKRSAAKKKPAASRAPKRAAAKASPSPAPKKKGGHLASQKEFPSLLYDTLYGLVLFFSLDSFLEITDPAHFVFYLFTTVVVVHWWLMFKAAEDVFLPGVRDTAAHVFVNIAYILLLEFMILHAKEFNYVAATGFLLAVVALDMAWVWAVEHAGKWRKGAKTAVAEMRRELDNIIRTNVALGVPLALLLVLGAVVTPTSFVALFVFLYVVYITLTFRYDIIDMKFL